jgi:copper chaperone
LTSFEKVQLKVVGMYCTTCKPIVEKQLRNNKGIKKVDIDYMADSIVVEFDPNLTNIKEIKTSLEKSGNTFVRNLVIDYV